MFIPPNSDIVTVVEYTTSKAPAVVECAKGHQWALIPSNLKSRGSGKDCPACNNLPRYFKDPTTQVYRFSKQKTTEMLLQEFKALKPAIASISEYKGAHLKVNVACRCGECWTVIPTNALSRPEELDCPKCYPKASGYGLDKVAALVQDTFPGLILGNYTSTTDPFKVLDPKCGHVTEVHYANIVSKGIYKCGTCYPSGTSLAEKELVDFVKANYTGWIVENDRTILEGKELDLVLPDIGLAIEYNGAYWHSDDRVGKAYHKDKTDKVQELEGYSLIHVNEYEWIYKQSIVKSRLLSQLGKTTKIYARKCVVKEIPFPKQFLRDNHIQGAGAPTSVNLGLFLEEALVAVMTFSKYSAAGNTYPLLAQCKWNLVRYCQVLNHTVVGGASKLLKYFTRNYSGGILSYSDRRWSTGDLYKTLGFTYSHTTEPGYDYYKTNLAESRLKYQKHKLKEIFPEVYKETLTEAEIMKQAGYFRVFDSGNDAWVLTRE